MFRIKYFLVYSVLWTFTLLPLRILYLISDIIYLINFYFIGYRKKVILRNLKNAFPNLSENERIKIAKKFYRHLSDFFLESVKPIQFSVNQLNKRFKFRNPQIFDDLIKEKKDITIVSGHYGNWEWCTNLSSVMPGYKGLVIYQPLQSKVSDKIIRNLRSKFGFEMVPMDEIYKRILYYRNLGIPTFTWFLADQRPPSATKFWTVFLNQETGFYMGSEKIAQKLGHAVVFMDINKVSRGNYEVEFTSLFNDASKTVEFEVTNAQVKKLEEIINQRPHLWLWSHNRWKHKKPANRELIA